MVNDTVTSHVIGLGRMTAPPVQHSDIERLSMCPSAPAGVPRSGGQPTFRPEGHPPEVPDIQVLDRRGLQREGALGHVVIVTEAECMSLT